MNVGTLDSLISIDPWISIDPEKICQKNKGRPGKWYRKHKNNDVWYSAWKNTAHFNLYVPITIEYTSLIRS